MVKTKKADIRIIILFIMFLLLTNITFAAHFICGTVNDVGDGASAGWREVVIYYENDEDNSEPCQVSPENNKYCCDAENIPGHTWNMGDEIFAELMDDGDGYFTLPVSIITTGEGVDVPSAMDLLYAVEINSPTSQLYGTSEISLDLSSNGDYTAAIGYELNNSDDTIELCTDCNEASETLELDDGSYLLTAYAEKEDSTINSAQVSFTIDTVNDAPSITLSNPSADNVQVNEEEESIFSVSASDPEDDTLSYDWSLNGDEVASAVTSYTFSSDEVGRIDNLSCAVSDGEFIVYKNWTIEIIEVVSCGDDTCSETENCTVCSSDCGECEIVSEVNATTDSESSGYSKVEKDSVIFFKFKDRNIALHEVIVWVNKDLEDVKIIAENLLTVDVDLSKDISVYSIVNTIKENLNNGDVDKIKLRFRVLKNWIETNNLDKDDINLFKIEGDKLIKLGLSQYDEDIEFYYYETDDSWITAYILYVSGRIEIPAEEVIEEKAEEFKKEEIKKEEEKALKEVIKPRIKFNKGKVIDLVYTSLIIVLALLLLTFIPIRLKRRK